MTRRIRLGLFIGLLTWSALAQAMYKCSAADGKTSFQDVPCAAGAKAEAIRPAPRPAAEAPSAATDWKKINSELDARLEIQRAIEERRPVRGMTRAQLDAAMGPPDGINIGDYPGGSTEQLIYERSGATWYVYTDKAFVTAVQQQSSSNSSARANPGPCPSSVAIRNEEVSATSIGLGNAERAERQRRISRMKECGR